MKNNYYSHQSELGLTACSVFLIASLTALKASTQPLPLSANNLITSCVDFSGHVYYAPADEATLQGQVLQRFAKSLLEATEDNPPVVVEVLNERFWDLV